MEKTIIRDVVRSLPAQNMQQQRLAQKKFEEERIKHTAIYAELMKESSSTETSKDGNSNTEGQSSESAADKEDEADDKYLINKWKTEANLYKEFSFPNEDNQAVSALRGTSDLTFITSYEGWTSMFTLSTSKSDHEINTLTLLSRKEVKEYDRRREELQMLVDNGSPLIDVIQNFKSPLVNSPAVFTKAAASLPRSSTMALFALGARLTEKVTFSTVAKYGAMELEENVNMSRSASESAIEEPVTSDGESESNAESEFGDKSAISYLSMLSNAIWSGQVERKPSYCSGNDSWVPSKADQIVELPKQRVTSYKKVYPLMGDDLDKNGSFAVISDIEAQVAFDEMSSNYSSPSSSRPTSPSVESPPNSPGLDSSIDSTVRLEPLDQPLKPPLHHLVISFWTGSKDNKHILSLYRSRRITDVIALCERCRECRELFRITPKHLKKEEYISELLALLKKHLLWKSAHIAAALGIVEYFKPVTTQAKNSLRVFCHPENWSPLLIAVQNNQVPLVAHLLTLGPDITVIDTNKNNVLHLAASASEEMVKLLMETGKCADMLNVPNAYGCSPLYLAVTGAQVNCAKAFRNYGASFTAIPPASSQTPLMDLMKRNKLDLQLMKAILDQNPEAVKETDPISGNGILHNASYKKPLIALLQLKADEVHLDARNSQMQTCLHLYVQRNDLSLVMAITAFNADLNAKDNNGNTPLHLAVSNNNLDIVRLLLCLGAEPNAINNHYETPRHLAAKMRDDETGIEIIRALMICGARTCTKGFLGCTVACVHKDNYVAEPKIPSNSSSSSINSKFMSTMKKEEDNVSKLAVDPNAPTAMYEFEVDADSHEVNPAYSEPNALRSYPQNLAIQNVLSKLRKFAEAKKESNIVSVLSLDGGGIKGLVIVQLLLALQKYLDQPLFNYFDWVAGTSTGSYVGGAACTGMSLRNMQKTYLRFKDALFDTWSRPYSAHVLEGFLMQMFGAETKLSDIKYPRVFFTTVRADTFPVQLELLRNYRLPVSEEENEEIGFEDPSGLLLWRAARRSSAAPTYFPSSEGKYIDGGMVSNNPTLDLMSEISFWNSVCTFVDPESPHTVDVGCVVSIGTGITPVSPVDPNLFEMNDMFGMLRGLKNLSLMVLDQVTATEGAPIARSRSWCHSLNIPYFRLNAPLFKDIVLDSKEDVDLVKMMWDVVVYSYTHRKDFEDLATLLKAIGTNKSRKKVAMTLRAPSPTPSSNSSNPTPTPESNGFA